jgi:hypothetical protein
MQIKKRLFAQRIFASEFTAPQDVLAHLLAIQGQDYAGAKWSLGLRAPGSTERDVERAFAAGHFVRTWAMRGTLHLVHAGDIHWLLALIGPKVIAASARRYRELELDEKTLSLSSDLITTVLSDGQPRHRKALMAVLEAQGISTAGQRAPYILAHAALQGRIYQNQVLRNEPYYALLQHASQVMEREEALAALARRYFTTRGPATLRDFIWWSGLSAADARLGLQSAAAYLLREQMDGIEYWSSPAQLPEDVQIPRVCLLPGFDEYVLSYGDRSAILDSAYMQHMTPKNGMLPPTILIAGKVSGTWKRTVKKDWVEVRLQLQQPVSDDITAAIQSAAQRFGDFLEKTAEVILAPFE